MYDNKEAIGKYIHSLPAENSDSKAIQILFVLPSSRPTCFGRKKGNVVDVGLILRRLCGRHTFSSLLVRHNDTALKRFEEFASTIIQVERHCQNSIGKESEKKIHEVKKAYR